LNEGSRYRALKYPKEGDWGGFLLVDSQRNGLRTHPEFTATQEGKTKTPDVLRQQKREAIQIRQVGGTGDHICVHRGQSHGPWPPRRRLYFLPASMRQPRVGENSNSERFNPSRRNRPSNHSSHPTSSISFHFLRSQNHSAPGIGQDANLRPNVRGHNQYPIRTGPSHVEREGKVGRGAASLLFSSSFVFLFLWRGNGAEWRMEYNDALGSLDPG
jgi:hypothetical protein